MSFWHGFQKRADDAVTQANAAAAGASGGGPNLNPVGTAAMKATFGGASSSGPGILSRAGDAIRNAFSGPSLGQTINTGIARARGG